MMKEYLTRKEAAEYMCVSLRGFQNLVKEWDIPSGKVPGAKIIFVYLVGVVVPCTSLK